MREMRNELTFDPSKRYTSKRPCRRCGGFVRHISSGSCVVCATARRRGDFYTPSPGDKEIAISMYREGYKVWEIQDKLRCPTATVREYIGVAPQVKTAFAPWKRTEGKPCVKCGCTTRYISSGSCVACLKEKNKQRNDR